MKLKILELKKQLRQLVHDTSNSGDGTDPDAVELSLAVEALCDTIDGNEEGNDLAHVAKAMMNVAYNWRVTLEERAEDL